MTTDIGTLIEGFQKEYPETDLYCYFGSIRRPFDDYVIEEIRTRQKHKHMLLFLTTTGGNPDAAYRISRCIQREYELEKESPGKKSRERTTREFYVFVDSLCVSAGTLLALGATKLILSDFCELGPLDIQLRKPDEPHERDSGLTPTQALESLERKSKSLFKAHFKQLRNDPDLSLTTKTSVEIAAKITSGLMGHIYAQIDPMRLGEVERLMGIAMGYGQRLAQFNLHETTLGTLLAGYPSHNFVIDRREARELFKNIEKPKPMLEKLGEELRSYAEDRVSARTPVYVYLTPEAVASDTARDDGGTVNDGQKPGRGGKRSSTKSKGTGRSGEGGAGKPESTE